PLRQIAKTRISGQPDEGNQDHEYDGKDDQHLAALGPSSSMVRRPQSYPSFRRITQAVMANHYTDSARLLPMSDPPPRMLRPVTHSPPPPSCRGPTEFAVALVVTTRAPSFS